MVKYLTSVKQKVSTDTHTVTTQASSVDVGQAKASTDIPAAQTLTGRKNTHRTQKHPPDAKHPSDREEIIHLTSVKQNVSTDAPSNYRHHESRYVGQISSDCEHIPAAVSPVQATIIAETITVQTHPHPSWR